VYERGEPCQCRRAANLSYPPVRRVVQLGHLTELGVLVQGNGGEDQQHPNAQPTPFRCVLVAVFADAEEDGGRGGGKQGDQRRPVADLVLPWLELLLDPGFPGEGIVLLTDLPRDSLLELRGVSARRDRPMQLVQPQGCDKRRKHWRGQGQAHLHPRSPRDRVDSECGHHPDGDEPDLEGPLHLLDRSQRFLPKGLVFLQGGRDPCVSHVRDGLGGYNGGGMPGRASYRLAR
jgi:hypothetical protein